MAGYFDRFSSMSAGRAYFIGANTGDGFAGDYDTLLSEESLKYKKIFIIKGGSGTGKSTMMRRVAAACENMGAKATYLLCSSDPGSFDGVLLEKNGVHIAIADGTAPHTLDPVYAGACGEIVNSGDCWDTAYLEALVDTITDIVNEKKACYQAAYRYISGATDAQRMLSSLGDKILLRDKMEACAGRIAAAEPLLGRKGKAVCCRTLAISMKGAVRLSTFENAGRLVSVEDCAFLAPQFMKAVSDAFICRGYDVYESVSPFGTVSEVLVPAADIAFVGRRDGVDYTKNINLRRFADSAAMQSTRQKRRFAKNCFNELLDGALDCLGEAWRLHSALEEIYIKGMDFSRLDSMTERLSQRLVTYFEK